MRVKFRRLGESRYEVLEYNRGRWVICGSIERRPEGYFNRWVAYKGCRLVGGKFGIGEKVKCRTLGEAKTVFNRKGEK